MGVYIKGMEMPKSCYVCPFCDYVSARCDAVNGNPYTPESRYEKRADFCPLVPVLPHGDLKDYTSIDREISMLPYENYTTGDIRRHLDSAPVIIPADPV